MADDAPSCFGCGAPWAGWLECPKCGSTLLSPMPDLKKWSESPRSIAAAVVLQLHGGADPDSSRSLADRVLVAVDRAQGRGHTHAAATDDEVHRARAELHRRGHEVGMDDVRAALNHALVLGWGQ
jgi:hypothetical protein